MLEVWKALTEKPLIDQYYMVPLLELELFPGGVIRYGTTEAMVEGRVTEVTAPFKLAHTFRFSGISDPESKVTYDLEALGEKMSILTITHEGLCHESQTYANIASGWAVIASSLKTLLETGKRLPWPER